MTSSLSFDRNAPRVFAHLGGKAEPPGGAESAKGRQLGEKSGGVGVERHLAKSLVGTDRVRHVLWPD